MNQSILFQIRMRTFPIALLLTVCLCTTLHGQIALTVKEITVLDQPRDQMVKEYMQEIAVRQFAARDSLLATLRTAEDWDRRARTVRDSMVSWTGPFPERTPLNARVTGRFEREDYVVEKVLFESRPGFLVSANLYLPRQLTGPRPAVLNVIGHSTGGKIMPKIQRRGIGLAKKGFVALTIDCIGQGERRIPMYPSSNPGRAHKTIGKQAFISGTHLFNFMAWDVIRAIDYLESRPEVDREWIGITGCSGGGMMSTYILPFEERISVAVPTCNPNTWAPRYYGGWGTDAEQNFFGAFRSGIDPRGDPLFAQVPKPLMINATTDDGNPAMGVWELSTWLYKAYAAHGVPEKFTTSMVQAGHGYNQEQREVTYAWMMRWAGIAREDFYEGDLPIEEKELLWASGTGSVYDEPGARLPQELVLDYLEEHRADWKPVTGSRTLAAHRSAMARSIGQALHTGLDEISVRGRLEEPRISGDLEVRPFVLEPEPGIVLPGVLIHPANGGIPGRTVLYLNVRSTIEDAAYGEEWIIHKTGVRGKAAILDHKEAAGKLLEAGYGICAVDLRGTGETGPVNEEAHWDFHTGYPMFGQRLRDVLATLKWLRESGAGTTELMIWGEGLGGVYGAFAGVLDEQVSGLVLVEPLISFESLVRVDIPRYGTEIILPGILEHFDMPQVYQALCPRPVTVINPLRGDKERAGKAEMEVVDRPVSATYRGTGSRRAWNMQVVGPGELQEAISAALTGRK